MHEWNSQIIMMIDRELSVQKQDSFDIELKKGVGMSFPTPFSIISLDLF